MANSMEKTPTASFPSYGPFLQVLSVGTGVTSSAHNRNVALVYRINKALCYDNWSDFNELGLTSIVGPWKDTEFLPMRPIFIPERARALRADWAPGPGVLVLLPPVARSLMCSAVIPSSWRQNTNSQITFLDTATLKHPYIILGFNLSKQTSSLDTQMNQWVNAVESL